MNPISGHRFSFHLLRLTHCVRPGGDGDVDSSTLDLPITWTNSHSNGVVPRKRLRLDHIPGSIRLGRKCEECESMSPELRKGQQCELGAKLLASL